MFKGGILVHLDGRLLGAASHDDHDLAPRCVGCEMLNQFAQRAVVRRVVQFADVFGGDREASVVREISKLHNTTHNGTLSELVDYFTATAPRGEIVIVVAGCPPATSVKVDKYAEFKQKKAKV